ncbi:MAG: hypothetical protein R2800_08290 [Flavipsychrobacter sp.]
MEDYTEHNEKLSNEYDRFVVRVHYKGEEYYTLRGGDWQDNYFDKVLLDGEESLLLFKTIDNAIDYAKNWENLFDKENWEAWLSQIKLPIEPGLSINLDLLNVDSMDLDNFPAYIHTVDAIDFAEEYCDQVDLCWGVDMENGNGKGKGSLNGISTVVDKYIKGDEKERNNIIRQYRVGIMSMDYIITNQKLLYTAVSNRVKIM